MITPRDCAKTTARRNRQDQSPPIEMEITCAPSLVAYSIARARLSVLHNNTEYAVRSGIISAPGATPVTHPPLGYFPSLPRGLTIALAVPVPWPGLGSGVLSGRSRSSV